MLINKNSLVSFSVFNSKFAINEDEVGFYNIVFVS